MVIILIVCLSNCMPSRIKDYIKELLTLAKFLNFSGFQGYLVLLLVWKVKHLLIWIMIIKGVCLCIQAFAEVLECLCICFLCVEMRLICNCITYVEKTCSMSSWLQLKMKTNIQQCKLTLCLNHVFVLGVYDTHLLWLVLR